MITRALVLLACSAAVFQGAEWSRFRGPNGTGVVESAALPDSFGPDRNLAWRTPLPNGYSSPVLSDSRIYLTGWEGLKLFTYCIDRKDGKILWQAEAPNQLAKEHKNVNTPVSPTPVTDGANVYVFFEASGLISYDAEGRERWRHAMGPFSFPYGAGSSPVLAGDILLILVDQDVKSYLLAMDRNSGKELWKAARPHATHGFSTPVVYQPKNGPAEVIVSGAYELDGYDLKTGKKLWWVTGMAWQAKSVPVVHGDTLYVHSWMASLSELGHKEVTMNWSQALAAHDKDQDGKISKEESPDPSLVKIWFLYDLDNDGFLGEVDWQYLLARSGARNGLYAIRLGGRGDVTKSAVIWTYDKGLPNIPSPLLYKDVLYVLREGGILTSFSPEDGAVLKQARIEGAVDAYFASPVAADGKIITASKEGKVAVIRAGAQWKTGSVHDFEEEIWATPAIGRNQLFIRTSKALYCFQQDKAAKLH